MSSQHSGIGCGASKSKITSARAHNRSTTHCAHTPLIRACLNRLVSWYSSMEFISNLSLYAEYLSQPVHALRFNNEGTMYSQIGQIKIYVSRWEMNIVNYFTINCFVSMVHGAIFVIVTLLYQFGNILFPRDVWQKYYVK